jgi:hypothetical protein
MAKRGKDKREHPRVEARLAMQLAEESLGEALVTTESLNISRGGVYCESSEYLAPLSKVALTVILPAFMKGGKTSMLRTEGVVVRCEALPAVRGRKRYQLACCFTGLDADGRGVLDQFVAWRALRGRAAALARAASGAGALARRTVAKAAVRKKVAVRKAVKKTAAKKVALKRAGAKKAVRRPTTPKKK